MLRCPACDGSGEPTACPECVGDGPCEVCDGSGYTDKCWDDGLTDCQVCKGEGEVPVTDTELEAAGQLSILGDPGPETSA